MSKALLFSDLHLHSHKKSADRLQDCLNVLHWVFETAKSKKVNHLFFLGDLFHERQKIDVLNYLRNFEVFVKHMSNAPFDMWLLIGNHDMYHKERWDINSIKPLTAIPRVHIIEEPKVVEIDGVLIDFLPHTEDPLKEIKKLKENRDKFQLLFGHIAVQGAQLNPIYGTNSDVIVEHDGEMKLVDPKAFAAWKQVFLGHYHCAQEIGNVEYIGSPLELSFGEAFQDKHLILFDLHSFDKQYIDNDFSPKHYILPPSQIKNYDLENNFIRIVVDDIGATDLIEIRKDLLRKHNVASLDIKQKEKKTDNDEELIDDAKAILYNEDEMLEKYVEETGVPDGLEKNTLLEWGKKICK